MQSRRDFLKLVAIAAPSTGAIIKKFVESDDYYESLETHAPATIPGEGIATFSCLHPVTVSGGYIIAKAGSLEIKRRVDFPNEYHLMFDDTLQVHYKLNLDDQPVTGLDTIEFEVDYDFKDKLHIPPLEKTSDVPKVT